MSRSAGDWMDLISKPLRERKEMKPRKEAGFPGSRLLSREVPAVCCSVLDQLSVPPHAVCHHDAASWNPISNALLEAINKSRLLSSYLLKRLSSAQYCQVDWNRADQTSQKT